MNNRRSLPKQTLTDPWTLALDPRVNIDVRIQNIASHLIHLWSQPSQQGIIVFAPPIAVDVQIGDRDDLVWLSIAGGCNTINRG